MPYSVNYTASIQRIAIGQMPERIKAKLYRLVQIAAVSLTTYKLIHSRLSCLTFSICLIKNVSVLVRRNNMPKKLRLYQELKVQNYVKI